MILNEKIIKLALVSLSRRKVTGLFAFQGGFHHEMTDKKNANVENENKKNKNKKDN